jgi:gliding motility-associated-like protein
LIFQLFAYAGFGQSNIVRVEYFFDSDPGLGLATPVSAFAPSSVIELNELIDVSSLSIGLHTLGIRLQDDNNLWSMSQFVPVLVTKTSATVLANITGIEYFFDSDPGIGAATSVPVAATPNFDINELISTTSLSAGLHNLYIRTMNEFGEWSIAESIPVLVTLNSALVVADINQIEYFFDTDPGIGAATSVPVAATPNFDINELISTTSLSAGLHNLYIRAMNEFGEWSIAESIPVLVTLNSALVVADINQIEYFFDTDPGPGLATAIAVTPAPTIDVNALIPTTSLSLGIHIFNLRIKTISGEWSVVESIPILVNQNQQISQLEYFYNVDPGANSANNIPIIPPVDSLDTTLILPTSSLGLGSNTIGIRLAGVNNIWGITEYAVVNVCDGANANFSNDIVCLGGTTSFTDISTNVLTGDVYSWDFNNDGLEDSNTAGNQAFTYPAAGIYTAKLSIDRLGCISLDSVQVNVEAIPVADAGLDQAICTTNTVLAGNPAGNNEAGTWSLLTGSAVIANPTDSLSVLTAITTNTVELIWNLTNTVGGCSDEDTVRIVANLPITAVLLEDSIDIGQTINIDVQTPAVVNPGDTLTTSIVTMPLYGMANLLADGTIDYIPDQDANSTDSLRYRITNQCSNFDENQVLFTVINSPPVIDTVNITPTVGSTEITIDLTTIISDPNGNIDFSTITVVTQPISGAVASIDASGVLTIDYRGITFTGTDRLEVQVCDLVGVCTIETITIPNVEVGGVNPPITVFNGVSPNGDGFNDFLEIENIEFYPDNTVIILNRWGAEIERFQGYNNQDIIFDNANLPSGTYYYHILPGVQDVQEVTGHFLLKID